MNQVIETSKQLEVLKANLTERAFCRVVENSDKYHPMLNEAIAIYLHMEGCEDGVIINIQHPEALPLPYEEVKEFLQSFTELYVLDKKHFLYYFTLSNLIDLQLVYTLENFYKLDLPRAPKTYTWYYRLYGDRRDINKIIPITKHCEFNEEIYYTVKDIFKVGHSSAFKFFNNIASPTFFLIEREGLQVEESSFLKTFKVQEPDLNTHNSLTYTYYNLYNPTSRPTNAFNSINFAAIPHTEEHRSCIVPKNDFFIEADFDGYHIRLISDLIDFKLDETSAHEQIGKLLFQKETLTAEEYGKTKQVNFQAMYGKTPQEYQHLEFFKGLDSYVNKMWTTFESQGEVRVPISQKPLTSKLPDLYPKKLFNYFLQGLESANNILILRDLIKLLRSYRSKVVLYTYDSILIDYSKEDGEYLISQIKHLMSKKNKFPVNIKQSKTLVF